MKPSGQPALVGLALLAMVLLLASSGLAYPRPGNTERVSVASDGTEADARSFNPRVSADGRYVAFASDASNLVPGDTNARPDVFVYDRQTGVTERVSVASDGTEGNSLSDMPAISADGRYVAFRSRAWNLDPDNWNGADDIFVHDRVTGTTERVSLASDGGEANHHSVAPSISADGRYVAFHSSASNLVPGDTNGSQDVFVHDRETGVTERVSVASDGTEGNTGSVWPSISADGRHVAFESLASNLVLGDTNGVQPGAGGLTFGIGRDIFVHDRQTGVTERVSVASDGTEAKGESYSPAISADGRHVAFTSAAANLVPGDTNGRSDAFVHDRLTGTTERVSVASDGTEANFDTPFLNHLSISADGRYVAFHSLASNLVGGDTNNAMDTFVHDRLTRTTERVSVGADGAQGDAASGGFWQWPPSLSADGRYVAFHSLASNLVAGDTNAVWDLFVRDRGPGVGVRGLSAVHAGGQVTVSGWATFSGHAVTSAVGTATAGAGPAGADLTQASLILRPEREDLLVRLHLASLPGAGAGGAAGFGVGGVGTGAGAPGIVYGVEFHLAGDRYEVRALRAAATSEPEAAPYFGLFRCDPACTEVARLSGGIGTTGNEVLVSVPHAALQVAEGMALTAARAFTAVGETASGTLAIIDEVDLPDAAIPAARVWLGVAPAGTPEEEVALNTEAVLADGAFSGTVGSTLLAGDYDVWARACLGEACGAASTNVVR